MWTKTIEYYSVGDHHDVMNIAFESYPDLSCGEPLFKIECDYEAADGGEDYIEYTHETRNGRPYEILTYIL